MSKQTPAAESIKDPLQEVNSYSEMSNAEKLHLTEKINNKI
jgi:hypothetical protein